MHILYYSIPFVTLEHFHCKNIFTVKPVLTFHIDSLGTFGKYTSDILLFIITLLGSGFIPLS